jgi:serine/threonine-protein kinase
VNHFSSPDSIGQGRFITGSMLAGRYRIVSLLGIGGMGEVYKAEDLKLHQTVALKFLPEAVALDGAMLARFHNEVRIARQVAHPNVCRVYDIGETQIDGRALHFLSMEFIDGEDLASLLRRIGRLPGDKAIELARQICAGVAAAHDNGVLHRDLKPANVMIDGRGKARVTDFGLAVVSEELRGDEVLTGTPAYMAPEQLTGKEATQRSDIYALGLVLYELFTGKRVFDAQSIPELMALHEKSTPTTPSSHVKEIDPLVERVILRCLEKDPRQRPASAIQVAAALPGGDPLAAALAAGETPSPEMVAASGESEGLRPAIASACLAGVIVAVTAVILLGAQTDLYRRVPLEKPPEVLTERAQNILQSFGYSEPPVDTAIGFYEGKEFLRYVAEHDKSKTRWDNLETGALVFWYRGSPRPLAARFSALSSDAWNRGVWTDDPALDVSGMTLVKISPLGRLTQLIVVPPQVEKPAGAAVSPECAALFSAAGIDLSKWTPSDPIWTPPVHNDARAAWTGSLPERSNIPMRIEAAAYQGKPVYFELIGPWTRPERMQPYQATTGERLSLAVLSVLLLSLLVGGAMLARRNLRLGRGDRRGASRIAAVVFAAAAVGWSFAAHHVPNFSEFRLFLEALVWTLAVSCFLWVLYIALEPYVRRRWPATLVSWSRLLAGGFRDPLVGRDVLVGCVSASAVTALGKLGWFVPLWLGYPPGQPRSGPQWQFLGARTIFANLAGILIYALFFWLAFLFVLVFLRVFLRKQWAAVAVVLLISALLSAASGDPVFMVVFPVWAGLAVFLLIRFGLLTMVANSLIFWLLTTLPLTSQVSAWYAGIGLAGILLMAAMVLYGFYTSLGGQKVFGGKLLED